MKLYEGYSYHEEQAFKRMRDVMAMENRIKAIHTCGKVHRRFVW